MAFDQSEHSNGQIFLSFNGEEIGTTFADHLFAALVDAGFRTLRSDDFDEDDMTAIEREIHDSRMSLVVLSGEYVCSGSCLRQLEIILNRHKRTGDSGARHSVVPVFYKVESSELRKPHEGRIGEALAKARRKYLNINSDVESHGGSEKEKTNRWGKALREVADMAGITYQDSGRESEFIKKIVTEIILRMERTMLYVTPYLVGMDSRAADINLWVQDGSTSVSFLVISGMGGIGKTTLAKFVYNKNFWRFDASSFIENVSSEIILKGPNGIVKLQEKLLFDVGRSKRKENIHSASEGIMKIRDAVGTKPVFLVLDDIDRRTHLNDLLGMEFGFCPGSKVIVTTRLQNILKSKEHHWTYEMKPLPASESLKVFSWHAFGQDHPLEDYRELSRTAVHHCHGHPLALEVIGSSLSERSDKDEWKSRIEKLKVIPNNRIIDKLKLSFDSLEDDHDKNLFLELVCYFLGKRIDYAIAILEKLGFFPVVGIHNLINRNLLAIESGRLLSMHQLVREMGRDIIRQQAATDRGKYTRLWNSEDSNLVLRAKIGTKTVKGMILDADMLESTWMLTASSPRVASDELVMDTEAFEKMKSLETLILNRVRLTGNYKKFPKQLKWLQWHHLRSTSMPKDLSLEKLIVLEIHHSSLTRVWMERKFLGHLKILDLSYSFELIRTPDFFGLPNLERLILKYCVKLMSVCESIGVLKHLVILDLERCRNLRRLPQSISQLESLQELSIMGCQQLLSLPFTQGMEKLVSLRISCGYNKLSKREHSSSSTGEKYVLCSPLQLLLMKSKGVNKCRRTTISDFSLPISLVKLNLQSCNLFDDRFPVELGNLSSLQALILSGNPLSTVPACIGSLKKLRLLFLTYCRQLKSFTSLPPSLEYIFLSPASILDGHMLLNNSINASRPLQFFIWMNGYDDILDKGALGLAEPVDIKSLTQDAMTRLRDMQVAGKKQKEFHGDANTFSFCLPGEKVPAWFTCRREWDYRKPDVCFVLTSPENKKFRGLYTCVSVSTGHSSSYEEEGKSLHLSIRNWSSCFAWSLDLATTGHALFQESNRAVWISCWEFESSFSDYDYVVVTIGSDDPALKIEEVGIHLVYQDIIDKKEDEEEEEEDTSQEVFAFTMDDHVSIRDIAEIFPPLEATVMRRECEYWRWEKPSFGWNKLNTSGFFLKGGVVGEMISIGGAGGVVSDASGAWIQGFAFNMGSCAFRFPALMGLKQGLEMAWEQGIQKLVVEMDSSLVLHWIYNASIDKHPFGEIIQQCRDLILRRPWKVKLRHVKRGRNRCALYLAQLGTYYLKGLSTFDQAPGLEDILALLKKQGTEFIQD